MLGHHHVVAGLHRRLLGEAHERHLGMAVDAPRHVGVVHRHRRVAQQLLDDQDVLGVADVGEPGGGDEVADRPHPLHRRAAPLVHLHEAPAVHADAGAGQHEAVRQRAPGPPTTTTASTLERVLALELDGVPVEPGTWPSTSRAVRTSIPRPLNERRTTLTTSLSTPGRICGSASSTVTSLPRSLIIDANSHPMAPPPITATLRGRGHLEHLVGREHHPTDHLEARDGARHRAGGEDHGVAGELGGLAAAPLHHHAAVGLGACRCRRTP